MEVKHNVIRIPIRGFYFYSTTSLNKLSQTLFSHITALIGEIDFALTENYLTHRERGLT